MRTGVGDSDWKSVVRISVLSAPESSLNMMGFDPLMDRGTVQGAVVSLTKSDVALPMNSGESEEGSAEELGVCLVVSWTCSADETC